MQRDLFYGINSKIIKCPWSEAIGEILSGLQFELEEDRRGRGFLYSRKCHETETSYRLNGTWTTCTGTMVISGFSVR